MCRLCEDFAALGSQCSRIRYVVLFVLGYLTVHVGSVWRSGRLSSIAIPSASLIVSWFILVGCHTSLAGVLPVAGETDSFSACPRGFRATARADVHVGWHRTMTVSTNTSTIASHMDVNTRRVRFLPSC